MKKILYVTSKTKIIIAIGYILLGSYAGANQLKIAEADMTNQKQAEEQVSDMELDKGKRNNFVTVSIAPSCSFINPPFSRCHFNLDFSTNYGIVFGKSALADAGILEGNITGEGGYSGIRWYFVVGGKIDINFIKNDGMNNVIPGLFLGADIGYNKVNIKRR